MLAGLIASLAAAGCTSEAEGTKTVTVETHVAPETPTPKRRTKRNPFPEQAAPTKPKLEFAYCDANIQVREDTTTCPFAQNTFWTYWTSGGSASFEVWSPAAHDTYSTACDSDGGEVTCTTSDGGAVKFSQAAVDRYSQSQADAYESGHDLGPDPYEGLSYATPGDSIPDYEPESTPPDYDTPTPGENIPNYDNGRGYRVQCADGMYSQSGGIQGACSGHGGVAD